MAEPEIDELTPKPKRAAFKHILWKVDGPLAAMTLNRPPYNIMNAEMLVEMGDAIESLNELEDLKVVLVRAAPGSKAFSAGVDIEEYSAQRVFLLVDAFHRIFTNMLEIGKPVITVVEGPALGGGCELASFGDMLIATSKAHFAQPELVKLGVFPPIAATIFPYYIGYRRAIEMLLTGEKMSAEEAQTLGLVNRIVPEDQLEEEVEKLVASICEQSAPVLQMTKRVILDGMGVSMRQALRNAENIFLNELFKLEDSQEGLRAILEKRKPQWKNR